MSERACPLGIWPRASGVRDDEGEVAERSEDGEGRGGIYLIPPTTLLR